MAGNALDRAEAKIGIENAEEGLNTVCSSLKIVGDCVYNLNNIYQGGPESKVTKVFVSYHDLIQECMESFGGASKHIFIDYHKGLVALINAGADGDEINPTIESHDKLLMREVPTSSNKKRNSRL